MHTCKVITYTPFMAGVKSFEPCTTRLSCDNGVTHIGYNHVVHNDEDVKQYENGLTLLECHDLLISDYDKIGHIVVERLPKTETCPHWLRAWTDLCYWNGLEILDSELAKMFINMDYEILPYKMAEVGGKGNKRSKWDATIHLYGTYGLPK